MRFLRKTIYYLLVVVGCFELAFWVLGYRPYRTIPYKVVANPPGAFSGDSTLGIHLNPGCFQITLNDSLTFVATHNAMGSRVVSSHMKFTDSTKKIHLFGCSYTYGYGVNDNETFAGLLQKTYPNYEVINHAVIGYGTIQALIQLEKNVSLKLNDIVIINFASAHFERNVLTQKYRSDLKIGFENSGDDVKEKMEDAAFPYLNEQHEIDYAKWSELYSHWWGRAYFCSINYLQSLYDKEADRKISSFDATVFILNEILQIVNEKNAVPVIFCLDNTSDTKLLQEKFPSTNWINADFDFADTLLTNHPYDAHPNAKGHKLLFEKLNNNLKFILNAD